jgi:hypothetical protein
MDLGALLAFEKAMYPSSHLSTSCPSPHQTTDQGESADTSFIVI